MLDLLEAHLTLQMMDDGPGTPWLGPAIRGAVGWAWREATCRQPRQLWADRWQRCRGCPYHAGCAYGRNVEPAYPPDVPRWQNGDPAPRMVLAPAFPMTPALTRGQQCTLSAKLTGAQDAADMHSLLAAIDAAGKYRGLGRHPRRVRFEVRELRRLRHIRLNPADLLLSSASACRPRRIRIDLTTPLILKAPQLPLTMDRLILHARMSIEHLLAMHGMSLQTDVAVLNRAAAAARLELHAYRPFAYETHSSRTGRKPMRGVIGWGVYRDVPACLIPWLTWAGAIHIGSWRACGSGGIRITDLPEHSSSQPAPSDPSAAPEDPLRSSRGRRGTTGERVAGSDTEKQHPQVGGTREAISPRSAPPGGGRPRRGVSMT